MMVLARALRTLTLTKPPVTLFQRRITRQPLWIRCSTLTLKWRDLEELSPTPAAPKYPIHWRTALH